LTVVAHGPTVLLELSLVRESRAQWGCWGTLPVFWSCRLSQDQADAHAKGEANEQNTDGEPLLHAATPFRWMLDRTDQASGEFGKGLDQRMNPQVTNVPAWNSGGNGDASDALSILQSHLDRNGPPQVIQCPTTATPQVDSVGGGCGA